MLQGLHRSWPALDRWCRQLESELAHTVRANAYLSPPRSSGLAEHADDHDVFVLHVAGSKDWRVEGLGELTLRPGHVLYLHAGARHAASAATTSSLHLTVGVLRATARDVVLRLLRTVEDPDLARPLPLGLTRPERRAALEAVLGQALRAAAGALAGVDPATAADGVVERRLTGGRRSGAGRVRSVAALDELGDGTTVVLRSDRSVRRVVEPAGGRVAVELADRRISMPAAMAIALDVLLSGRPVRVGTLPGLDEGDRRVLVRRLVVEGVLDVVGG